MSLKLNFDTSLNETRLTVFLSFITVPSPIPFGFISENQTSIQVVFEPADGLVDFYRVYLVETANTQNPMQVK